jgi:hypothetical protein
VSGTSGSKLEVAAAVRAGALGEAVYAFGAPRALEGADVGLVVRRQVAITALAVRADIKHESDVSELLMAAARCTPG